MQFLSCWVCNSKIVDPQASNDRFGAGESQRSFALPSFIPSSETVANYGKGQGNSAGLLSKPPNIGKTFSWYHGYSSYAVQYSGLFACFRDLLLIGD